MSLLEDLHNAITTTLKHELQGYEVKKNLVAPALLVELASFEPGSDPGTGELSLRVKFEARVIVDSTNIHELVAKTARVVHQNTWGMEVSPAEFLGAHPDEFKHDAYTVWVVEWVHELHQGDNNGKF